MQREFDDQFAAYRVEAARGVVVPDGVGTVAKNELDVIVERSAVEVVQRRAAESNAAEMAADGAHAQHLDLAHLELVAHTLHTADGRVYTHVFIFQLVDNVSYHARIE